MDALRYCFLSAALVIFPCFGVSRADTLILKDGQQVKGKVEKVDGHYIVRGKASQHLKVREQDVAELIREGDATDQEDGEKPTHGLAYAENPTEFSVAFPVGPDLLVTSASAVANAKQMHLQNREGDLIAFQVLRTDERTNLALLWTPQRKGHYLLVAEEFDGGPVECVGYPDVNLFAPVPETIKGEAPKAGKEWLLNLRGNPQTPGPVLHKGRVVGVHFAGRHAEPSRLQGVPLSELRKFLGGNIGRGGQTYDPESSDVVLLLAVSK